MLGDISIADNIYIVTGYTDMRKSIDGLCAIILNQMQTEPDSHAIYLFCGKRCDRIKGKRLVWGYTPKLSAYDYQNGYGEITAFLLV